MITRVNHFKARPGQGPALHGLLVTALRILNDMPGYRAHETLQGVDSPEDIIIIERWAAVDDHKAAVAAIPPESFAGLGDLLAAPPTGVYYS
ncbi:MAG TPA: antibiotic biosynthesis monooxygenase family protein [Pseudomonadales bacterium]|nr:antibiotic biosynthesis monooxygenase family protein [Pseudomonadales bacterium]